MKPKFLTSALMALTAALLAAVSCSPKKEAKNYTFDGSISREVLENYLSRAVTLTELLVDSKYSIVANMNPDKTDDVRLIKNIGAKFIGRAITRWDMEEHLIEPDFWDTPRRTAQAVHEADPEVILQGAIFETVSPNVNLVKVPAWVFGEFGMPVEDRNFRLDSMLNLKGRYVGHWNGVSSVPDITRPETQLWYMYLFGSYLDIGVEAIHWGQIALIGMEDPGFVVWKQFLDKMREYAKVHARRHYVLFDAHTPGGGMVVDGVSLLDFNSFPMRIKEIEDKPEQAELEVGYLDALFLRSKGCIAPSGWSCDALPYLVEIDNFGINNAPGKSSVNTIYVWGYDEISWFARQPREYQKEWLAYADNWVRTTDPAGHLQMPVARKIAPGMDVPRERARFNTPSEICPEGLGLEETIKTIWENQK